jgi:chromosome segregation ATPase
MIVRSEDTAFLSKHLRAYGGSGDYQGNRVGRLIRNLTFSGKGLVKVPGNPESIIFDNEDNEIFKGMAAASIQPITNLNKETGDVSMAETNEQIRTLEGQVQELKTSNASLEKRLKAMDEAQVQAKFDSFATDVASRDEQIVALKASLEEAQAGAVKSAQSLQELEDVKAKSEKKLGELTEKLAAIDAEIIKTNRISALVDKGVEKVEAETIVSTYSGVSDEQFEAVVNTHADLVEAKNGVKNEVSAENEAEALNKADAKSENDSEGLDDEAGDAETLAQAEAEKDAALTVDVEDAGDVVMASLSKYFTGVLGGSDDESQS